MNVELEHIPIRHFMDASIHCVTLEQATQICREAVVSREPLTVGVVNSAKLVKMRDDAWLRDSVLGSDLIVADGLPVVWASRILGEPLPERVTGIDLFEKLLELANREGFSVYFLGAAQEVLDEMVRRIGERYSSLRCAGSRNGYFDDDETDAVIDEIRVAAPDMLFVGISTPKKERFLKRCGEKLSVPVCHGVGGSFDVMAGLTRRAPVFWQKAGLEWFYRLLQEPRRMWRRYLVTNSAFVALLVREWFRKKLA
jgi:N-acetylglucosaminyldiphosphoundecaprenol N-acetyl-beta-D-mannosaminyltransferase